MGDRLASRSDVARLFGRAAFGATQAQLDQWQGKPYADVVESLVTPAGGPLTGVLAPAAIRSGSLDGAQRSWLEQMRSTSTPLVERMTLFWHDHFATGVQNPQPNIALLVNQNDTIRTHALGSVRELVRAMNIDPAMLFWLNGTQSARPIPNENYARELFELFTLGKYPQVYSEGDIREAARALTGWVANAGTQSSAFNANRHDAGQKTVLGRRFGNLAAEEHLSVTEIALEQPVAPRFIAYKLVRNFAYEPAAGDLLRNPDPLVARVAAALRNTNWDIRSAVRTLLLSDEFRLPSPGRQIVRQPAESVVATCKALGISADTPAAVAATNRMGQRLFDPPSVGGWPVGATWLSPGSMLARYDFAVAAWTAWNAKFPKPALPAAADLGAWTALAGLAGLSGTTDATLRAYLDSRRTAPELERQQGVFTLIFTSPDWMVF